MSDSGIMIKPQWTKKKMGGCWHYHPLVARRNSRNSGTIWNSYWDFTHDKNNLKAWFHRITLFLKLECSFVTILIGESLFFFHHIGFHSVYVRSLCILMRQVQLNFRVFNNNTDCPFWVWSASMDSRSTPCPHIVLFDHSFNIDAFGLIEKKTWGCSSDRTAVLGFTTSQH